MEITEGKTSKIESVKKFWADNKTKLFVTSTVLLAAGVAMQKTALAQHNDFLKQNDIQEAFWKFIGADEDDIATFHKQDN